MKAILVLATPDLRWAGPIWRLGRKRARPRAAATSLNAPCFVRVPARSLQIMREHLQAVRIAHLLAIVAAVASVAGRANAQTVETIETVRRPLSGSTRYIGLGGASVAIADNTDGVAINAAAAAVRLPYSWSTWDYGFGLDFAVGAWLPKNDLYNRLNTTNASGKTPALFGSLAAIIYYGQGGLGVSAEAQSNAASRQDQVQGIARNLGGNFGALHASLAYGYVDGQLLLGVGPRLVGISFGSNGSGSAAFTSAGVGYEVGVIVKPRIAQYRVAAALKSPINAKLPAALGEARSTARVPWDLALGFAYQFGPRPLNPPLVTVEDFARAWVVDGTPSSADVKRAERALFERYERLQRWYLLVSTELSLTEADGDHVGIEQYWTNGASDTRPIIVPRIGVEGEMIPRHLRLRGGSYYEPARIGLSPSRIHGTGGFDVRLFEWDVFGLHKPFDYWQLSIAADAARSYLNTSFSIGFWH